MYFDDNYSIYLSVSDIGFQTKQEAVHALPYYLDKDTKAVNPSVCYFQKTSTTIPQLADLISTGHSFCAVYSRKKFTAAFKKSENFHFTQTVFFDIDHADTDLEVVMDSLPYEPSIAYRTFSDTPDDHHYRLVYVLDEKVNGFDFDFVYGKMADVCGIDWRTLDARPKDQCYFGTDKADSVVVSNIIYSLEDFGIQLPEEHRTGIRTLYGVPVRTHSEMIPSASGHYYTYPDVYFEIRHYFTYDHSTGRAAIVKKKNGEHRRRSLWKVGQIYMYLNPHLTRDQLYKVLQYELQNYYDNSEDVIPLKGERSIESIAKSAYTTWDRYPISQPPHGTFKINVKYWQSVMNNDNGKYIPVVAVAKCRREITEEKIAGHFNPELSIADNRRILAQNGIAVSEGVLYRYRKETLGLHACKQSEMAKREEEMIRLLSENGKITNREIAERLGVSERTVKRIRTGMKSRINNESNSITMTYHDITTLYKGQERWTCKLMLPDDVLDRFREREPNENGHYPFYFEDVVVIGKDELAKKSIIEAALYTSKDPYFISLAA